MNESPLDQEFQYFAYELDGGNWVWQAQEWVAFQPGNNPDYVVWELTCYGGTDCWSDDPAAKLTIDYENGEEFTAASSR